MWILDPAVPAACIDPAKDLEPLPGRRLVLADLRNEKRPTKRPLTAPPDVARNGILFLGSGLATLASVAITELFTGGELTPGRA